MTARGLRARLAAVVTVAALVVSSCGGSNDGAESDQTSDVPAGSSAGAAADEPPAPSDSVPSDPRLTAARAAVELFGSVADAGVAMVLAADAGYHHDQIVEAIDAGALRADGSIDDGSGGAVLPDRPATGAIEEAAGASIKPAGIIAVPLRSAGPPTRDELHDRFAEIARGVQNEFVEEEAQLHVLAAVLRALEAGLDGQELVEYVVTGQLPDHAIAAAIFGFCEATAFSGDDDASATEDCITAGPYGEQPDSIVIMALGLLDARIARIDFLMEDLCRKAANPNPEVCSDYLDPGDSGADSDGRVPDAPEAVAPDAPSRATSGTWSGSASDASESESRTSQSEGSATIELRDGVYHLSFDITSDSVSLGHDSCSTSSVFDGEASAEPNESGRLVFTTDVVRQIASDCPFYEKDGGYVEEEAEYSIVGYLLDDDVIRLDLLPGSSIELDHTPG